MYTYGLMEISDLALRYKVKYHNKNVFFNFKEKVYFTVCGVSYTINISKVYGKTMAEKYAIENLVNAICDDDTNNFYVITIFGMTIDDNKIEFEYTVNVIRGNW